MVSAVRTVSAGGCEMQCFSFGTGKRIMAVIPGVSLSSVMDAAPAVAAAYKLFADDFTVYVFDRRLDMPEGYTVRQMADDTAAVMRELGLSDVCVLGVSQGGMIAQCIAMYHPGLVDKLVLASTTSRHTKEDEKLFDRVTELARKGEYRELELTFAEAVYSQYWFAKYRDIFAAFSEKITPENAGRFIVMTKAMYGFDVYYELDAVKCPVLVVCGSEDKVFGAAPSEDLAARLGCELCVFEGFGHAVYDETPEFKKKVFDFFMG